MSTQQEKKTAKFIQSRLKELGYDVKLGHAYEILAAVSGNKSWNVASQKKIPTTDTFDIWEEPKYHGEDDVKHLICSEGKNTYLIKLQEVINCVAHFTIEADSKKEAIYKMKELIDADYSQELWGNLELWKIMDDITGLEPEIYGIRTYDEETTLQSIQDIDWDDEEDDWDDIDISEADIIMADEKGNPISKEEASLRIIGNFIEDSLQKTQSSKTNLDKFLFNWVMSNTVVKEVVRAMAFDIREENPDIVNSDLISNIINKLEFYDLMEPYLSRVEDELGETLDADEWLEENKVTFTKALSEILEI